MPGPRSCRFVPPLGLFVLLLPAAVRASFLASGDTVFLFDREGSSRGGEFGVGLTRDPKEELFRTFCLERTERVRFQRPFRVDSVTTAAYSGGGGASGSPARDPLDPRTAYLYSQFREGTLEGYDDGPGTAGHVASANQLQRAVRYLEGEIPGVGGQALLWVEEAAEAVAAGLWSGLGGVRVLNLTYPDGRLAQSQLMVVPEPAALALGALGLAGVALTARRRRAGEAPESGPPPR